MSDWMTLIVRGMRMLGSENGVFHADVGHDPGCPLGDGIGEECTCDPTVEIRDQNGRLRWASDSRKMT